MPGLLYFPLLGGQRAAMFWEMGPLASDREADRSLPSADYLSHASPRWEYRRWVALSRVLPAEPTRGAGVHLRPILLVSGVTGDDIVLVPEDHSQSVCVAGVQAIRRWRSLTRSVLTSSRSGRSGGCPSCLSDNGRRRDLTRLRFVLRNEMRLETPRSSKSERPKSVLRLTYAARSGTHGDARNHDPDDVAGVVGVMDGGGGLERSSGEAARDPASDCLPASGCFGRRAALRHVPARPPLGGDSVAHSGRARMGHGGGRRRRPALHVVGAHPPGTPLVEQR